MSDPTRPPPQVSVALCTYNGERHLAQQLESVLAQAGVDLEVVALDDGSSDATRELLAHYAARDPRLRWSTNPRNLGPTASFEQAMAVCRGAFIAPCDQDDLWRPGKLAALLACIGQADLAYCDSEFVDANARPLGRCIHDDMPMLAGAQPLTFLLANSVSGHACLVRRDLFARARPFPAGAYHDWWLALCAAGRNGVRYLPEPLVAYRRHDEAISPMGRDGRQARDAGSSRQWLEWRRVLMRAYAGTGLRQAELGTAFADALDRALAGGGRLPLARLLWRHRRELPPWRGWPALAAYKWQSRLARRIRRARTQGQP